MDQEALRSEAARKERRTWLLIAAALAFVGSASEPLYRPFNAPLLAVRVVWAIALGGTGLALPRASSRLYGILLPLSGLATCWLYATTVWLNGGLASPDFQYLTTMPLAMMVVFGDEMIACGATGLGTVSAVAVLCWASNAPVSVLADSLASDVVFGTLAMLGAFSFRRIRRTELATQRARAEALEQLALSERRRAQSERLASLGQLAAGVAHEINNPLQALSANVELLAGHAGEAAPGATGDTRVVLDDLQLGIARIAQIVRDLREFSSGGADKVQPCRVDEVIGDALRLASFKLGKAIEVRQSCAEDLPEVAVNRRKLSQVLLNLLVNAAEAMLEARTEHPRVVIAAGCTGDAVQIAVQDNGPGIAAEIAARLFEPFVTSKPVSKGTGLGLALSREYVASFGGRLELEPSAGPGARFTIVLPAAPLAA